MPTITLRGVTIEDETQLSNLLRSLNVLELKDSSDGSIFNLDELEEGKTYSLGRSIPVTNPKRKRLSGIRKHSASKAIKV